MKLISWIFGNSRKDIAEKEKPCCAGGVAHDCHVGANCKVMKKLKAKVEKQEPLVPLRMEWEEGYPEDVAFGSQRQMDRLKKWLDKYFAMVQAEKQERVICDIQMDECSSQPEKAPRCMTCGKWTDTPCQKSTHIVKEKS